jgi:hypothetical protein
MIAEDSSAADGRNTPWECTFKLFCFVEGQKRLAENVFAEVTSVGMGLAQSDSVKKI